MCGMKPQKLKYMISLEKKEKKLSKIEPWEIPKIRK